LDRAPRVEIPRAERLTPSRAPARERPLRLPGIA